MQLTKKANQVMSFLPGNASSHAQETTAITDGELIQRLISHMWTIRINLADPTLGTCNARGCVTSTKLSMGRQGAHVERSTSALKKKRKFWIHMKFWAIKCKDCKTSKQHQGLRFMDSEIYRDAIWNGINLKDAPS